MNKIFQRSFASEGTLPEMFVHTLKTLCKRINSKNNINKNKIFEAIDLNNRVENEHYGANVTKEK